jgi:hypothetical protein
MLPLEKMLKNRTQKSFTLFLAYNNKEKLIKNKTFKENFGHISKKGLRSGNHHRGSSLKLTGAAFLIKKDHFSSVGKCKKRKSPV